MQKEKEQILNSDLISRLRAGDESAFRVVFELYFNKLYTFSFRFLKDEEQSKEVVQEAFLSLWVNRAKLDEQLPIAPYLYTITRRLALNVLRNIASSQVAMDNLWYKVQKVSNETEELVLADDLEDVIEKALLKLPKQQQLVFRMSRLHELSYTEISDELEISRNTVKNHLVAALKTLRIELTKAFFFFF